MKSGYCPCVNIVPSNLLNVMCTHLVCVSVWVYACVCVHVCVNMPRKKTITQFNINITEVIEIHHPWGHCYLLQYFI